MPLEPDFGGRTHQMAGGVKCQVICHGYNTVYAWRWGGTAGEGVGNVSAVFTESCDISLHSTFCALCSLPRLQCLSIDSSFQSPLPTYHISLKLYSYTSNKQLKSNKHFQLYMFKNATVIFERSAHFLVPQILMEPQTFKWPSLKPQSHSLNSNSPNKMEYKILQIPPPYYIL